MNLYISIFAVRLFMGSTYNYLRMIRKIFGFAFASIKQTIKPGMVIWILALLLVVLYYFFKPSQAFFNFFGNLKIQNGRLYAVVSTSLFGGLIPYVYLLITGAIHKNRIAELFFYLLFWAIKGWEVDLLYTYQGIWFGAEPGVLTIIKKALVDQFIYSTLWAAPSIAIFYLWKNCNFSFNLAKQQLNKEFFSLQLPALILSNWIIWIPAVSIIYSLPMQLQIPLFNLVICFWVLLLAILNKK